MLEPTVIRPEIALNDFLPIFLSSSFVLLFGLFFVAIYTLVKLDVIKKFICLLRICFGCFRHTVCTM